MKSSAKKINLILGIIFFIIFVGSFHLELYNNEVNARNTCSLIIKQLEDSLQSNKRTFKSFMHEMKDEYIVRAKTVSLIISGYDKKDLDVDFFRTIAKRVSVDEINVYNEDGILVYGSNPEYFGLNIESNAQMEFFMPMLSERTFQMCQDIVPDSSNKKSMVYAMVWNRNRDHMIQIGISSNKIQGLINLCDEKNLVSNIPVIEGMEIFIVDSKKDIVVGCSRPELIGIKGTILESKMDSIEQNLQYTEYVNIGGKKNLLCYKRSGDYILSVTYQNRKALKNLVSSTIILAVSLVISFMLVSYWIIRLFKAVEKSLAEVKKANNAKSDFLSRMSHDIRTPLNGIIGLLEIEIKHPEDTALLRENRGKALEAAKYLLALINDVLEISRLDRDEVNLKHEAFSIEALANDVLKIIGIRAMEQGIRLEYDESSESIEVPYVFGSPVHIRQIFLNILSNAIKFNKKNGTIKCAIKVSHRTEKTVIYEVKITDTGIGMKPEFIKEIFEPFTQEYIGARGSYNGNGLSLSIVKSILDKIGGTIHIESEKGEGSIFTVCIPFDIATEADLPELEEKNDFNLKGRKFLLVEDNDLNREIATMILRDLGAVVVEAHNGHEAVVKFTENGPNTYDAILMDLMMPEMDGITATKSIRAFYRDDAKTIPIIAMTANAFDEDIQKCIEAGMNGHVSKPIDVNELIKEISINLE